MDDAFIKINTALLDKVSRPFPTNGNGGEQSKPKLASPPANCRNPECGQPLIEHEFTKGFELTCDTVGCFMFRRPQGCRPKRPLQAEPKPPISKREQPNYQRYLEQRMANYQRLRELGFGSVEAGRCASNKKVREIEGQIRNGTELTLTLEEGNE